MAQAFNNRDYSDITIKFSDREIQAHKVILCTNSQYFKRLCGAGSKFTESKAREIELKDDDPDALEALLRFFYDQDVTRNDKADWKFQVELAKVSNKYLEDRLEQQATHVLNTIVTSNLTDIDTIIAVIETIHTADSLPAHVATASQLELKHASVLLLNRKFRKVVENAPSLIWKHIDRLNPTSDIAELRLWTCSNCHRSRVRIAESGLPISSCSSGGRNTCVMVGNAKCVMSLQAARAFNAGA